MPTGTVLLVHGTGVRLKAFQRTYRAVSDRAAREGIAHAFAECEWGVAFGIDPPRLSIPGTVDADEAREQAAAAEEWAHLDDDPLFELRLLTIVDRGGPSKEVFGRASPALELWTTVERYQPTKELEALLRRLDAWELWPDTWSAVVSGSTIAKRAILASHDDLADAAMALARALYAEMSRRMEREGVPAPGAEYRTRFVERLRVDWGFQVFALTGRLKALVAGFVRQRRRRWTERVWPAVGDVMLYLAHGEGIVEFIRQKVTGLKPPVYLLAHSLGGIACVDLLARPGAPDVAGLITVGSQAPLLYELGALRSLQRPQRLPPGFPRWLNLFDMNDLLSYVGRPLFGDRVTDVEIHSGDLPMAAHSAYWHCDETWTAIKGFVA
jgi:hypothetical protein